MDSHALKEGFTEIREAVICRVCDRLLYEPYTTECGHTFCYGCLSRWLQQHPSSETCPNCRASLSTVPTPSFVVGRAKGVATRLRQDRSKMWSTSSCRDLAYCPLERASKSICNGSKRSKAESRRTAKTPWVFLMACSSQSHAIPPFETSRTAFSGVRNVPGKCGMGPANRAAGVRTAPKTSLEGLMSSEGQVSD